MCAKLKLWSFSFRFLMQKFSSQNVKVYVKAFKNYIKLVMFNELLIFIFNIKTTY